MVRLSILAVLLLLVILLVRYSVLERSRQALEFIAEDESVEVTPKSVRLRKVILDQAQRARTRKKA